MISPEFSILSDLLQSPHQPPSLTPEKQTQLDYFYFKQNLWTFLTLDDNPKLRKSLKTFVKQYKNDIQSLGVEDFEKFIRDHFIYDADPSVLSKNSHLPICLQRMAFCFELLGDLVCVNSRKKNSTRSNHQVTALHFLIHALDASIRPVDLIETETNYLYFLQKPESQFPYVRAENVYFSLYCAANFIQNQGLILDDEERRAFTYSIGNFIGEQWLDNNTKQCETIHECVQFFKKSFCHTPTQVEHFKRVLAQITSTFSSTPHPYFAYEAAHEEKNALSDNLKHATKKTSKKLKI